MILWAAPPVPQQNSTLPFPFFPDDLSSMQPSLGGLQLVNFHPTCQSGLLAGAAPLPVVSYSLACGLPGGLCPWSLCGAQHVTGTQNVLEIQAQGTHACSLWAAWVEAVRQEAGSGFLLVFLMVPRLNEGNHFLTCLSVWGQVYGVVWAVTGQWRWENTHVWTRSFSTSHFQ